MIPNVRFWRNRSVVVTGGTGFLGSHIVRCLQDLGGRGSGCSLTRHRIVPILVSSSSLATFEICRPSGKHSHEVVFHTAGNVTVFQSDPSILLRASMWTARGMSWSAPLRRAESFTRRAWWRWERP